MDYTLTRIVVKMDGRTLWDLTPEQAGLIATDAGLRGEVDLVTADGFGMHLSIGEQLPPPTLWQRLRERWFAARWIVHEELSEWTRARWAPRDWRRRH